MGSCCWQEKVATGQVNDKENVLEVVVAYQHCEHAKYQSLSLKNVQCFTNFTFKKQNF